MLLLKKRNRTIILQILRNYRYKKELQEMCRKYENYSPPPPAQQIRICNIEQLHAVSKVRVCECPPKQRAPKYAKRNIRTVWLLVKLATFCGTIYVTKGLGIWTTSDETEIIYLRMYDTVQALLGDTDELKKNMKIPDFNKIQHSILDHWNRAIINAFSYFGLMTYPKISDDNYIGQKIRISENKEDS